MRLLTLFLFVYFSLIGNVNAQLPIGTWKDYVAFKTISSVDGTEDKIYAADDIGVLVYDRIEHSFDRISRVNGLSDVGISLIRYSEENDVLVVTYENGNIDLIRNNEITNLPFLKFKDITGDKTVNAITFNEKDAYLSCGFGILVLNLASNEIKDTYIIGDNGQAINVSGVAFYNDTIYASTGKGIRKASINAPVLADFSYWKVEQNFKNKLIAEEPFAGITLFNGSMFALYQHPIDSDTLFILENGEWIRENKGIAWSTNIRSIKSDQDHFYLNLGWMIRHTDKNWKSADFSKNSNNGSGVSIGDAVVNDNEIYAGDSQNGLMHGTSSDDFSPLLVNGPASNSTFDLEVKDGIVVLTSGTVTKGNYSNLYNSSGFSVLENDIWRIYNKKTKAELAGEYFDVLSAAIDPENTNRIFGGTWSPSGLIEVNGDVIVKHDTANSTLQHWAMRTDDSFILIADLAFDEKGNLWVSNGFTKEPLSVYTKEGEWKSFFIGTTVQGNLVTKMIHASNGYIYMLVDQKGILVFDYNGTIDDDTDDQYVLLNKSVANGSLPSSNTYSIIEDIDGEIWIGSDEGVFVLFNPSAIFSDGGIQAQQIFIEQEGHLQVLLETEKITAIAVDGGNRKWFGTEGGGVFVTSEDGVTQLENFNTENSPIFSNTIESIGINENTGETFIATNKGLLSYFSGATEGDPKFSDVLVYPNPVQSSFTGDVVVKGLARDSDVKITDVSGNIVFVTESIGGQAVWNTKNLRGDAVTNGVYLIFATDQEGNEGMVSKIAVTR